MKGTGGGDGGYGPHDVVLYGAAPYLPPLVPPVVPGPTKDNTGLVTGIAQPETSAVDFGPKLASLPLSASFRSGGRIDLFDRDGVDVGSLSIRGPGAEHLALSIVHRINNLDALHQVYDAQTRRVSDLEAQLEDARSRADQLEENLGNYREKLSQATQLLAEFRSTVPTPVSGGNMFVEPEHLRAEFAGLTARAEKAERRAQEHERNYRELLVEFRSMPRVRVDKSELCVQKLERDDIAYGPELESSWDISDSHGLCIVEGGINGRMVFEGSPEGYSWKGRRSDAEVAVHRVNNWHELYKAYTARGERIRALEGELEKTAPACPEDADTTIAAKEWKRLYKDYCYRRYRDTDDKLIELQWVNAAMVKAASGEAVSDFEQSFGPVRHVQDLRQRLEEAERRIVALEKPSCSVYVETRNRQAESELPIFVVKWRCCPPDIRSDVLRNLRARRETGFPIDGLAVECLEWLANAPAKQFASHGLNSWPDKAVNEWREACRGEIPGIKLSAWFGDRVLSQTAIYAGLSILEWCATASCEGTEETGKSKSVPPLEEVIQVKLQRITELESCLSKSEAEVNRLHEELRRAGNAALESASKVDELQLQAEKALPECVREWRCKPEPWRDISPSSDLAIRCLEWLAIAPAQQVARIGLRGDAVKAVREWQPLAYESLLRAIDLTQDENRKRTTDQARRRMLGELAKSVVFDVNELVPLLQTIGERRRDEPDWDECVIAERWDELSEQWKKLSREK